MSADQQQMIDQLLAQTTVAPQPSFMGLQAPPNAGELQNLLSKLKQQQFLQQQQQATPGEFGFLHDAGRAGMVGVGQQLGNILQPAAQPPAAPPMMGAPDAGQPSGPQSAQQSIAAALQKGKQVYAAQIQAGVDPDKATVNTLKLLSSLGVPGADMKLGEAQTNLLGNDFKKSEAAKDNAQAAMDKDEITNRHFDQDTKTWVTTQKDPAGFFEIQTNGQGEDRRVELKPKPNAGDQASANLSPQGMAFLVKTYKDTGVVPQGLARSPAMAGRFWSAVASDPEVSGDPQGPRAILANKMANQANGTALAQTQKQLSQTTSYFQTMDKNIANAQEMADKLDFSDPTIVNRALNAWNKGTSDPTTAKYNVFFDSVANEYAKIKSGALGNTAVSDTARKEAQSVLTPLISAAGAKAAFDAVRQEGNNRLASLSSQRDQLIQTLQGRAPISASGAPGMGETPPAPAGPKVLNYDPATGKFN